MREDKNQDGAEVPAFPFEYIEARICKSARDAATMARDYLDDGGTGENLLTQINERKSPVLPALLFSDHYLPILELIPDFSGCSKPAVYCAAANGSAPLLRLLLERGADPYLYMDSTPAFVAAGPSGSPEAIACADVLARAGVDVNVARRDSGMTALMRAAGEGHVEFVRHLLAAGADVSRRDARGRTALHWALGYGSQAGLLNGRSLPAECVEVARLLLKAGADLNERDFDRMAPIHYFVSSRMGLEVGPSSMALDLLIRSGADLEARNAEDATPMLLAALNSQRGGFLIPMLHDAGASLDATARGKMIEDIAGEETLRAIRSIRMRESLGAAMQEEQGAQPGAPKTGILPL